MSGFDKLFDRVNQEFWGMTFRQRSDSYKHDLARAKASARR